MSDWSTLLIHKEIIHPHIYPVRIIIAISIIASFFVIGNVHVGLGFGLLGSILLTFIFFEMIFKIELHLRRMSQSIPKEISTSKEASISDMIALMKHLKDQDTKNQEDFRHAMKFLHDDLMRIEAKLKEKS